MGDEPSLELLELEVGAAGRDLHMEDRTLIDCGMKLFGVFDGVSSGGSGGQVATLAVDAVQRHVAERGAPTTVREAHALLVGALDLADAEIGEFNRRLGGGAATNATTAAVLLVFQPPAVQPALVAVAATLGDSRIQLLRDGSFHTLTLDHAYLGAADPGEAKAQQDRLDDALSLADLADPLDQAAFIHRNLISSALNGSRPTDTRYYAFRLVPGDRLLVDSDGVHDNLSSHDLAEVAAEPESAQQAADAVSDAAWEASRHDPGADPRAKPDDVSVIVVDIPGD